MAMKDVLLLHTGGTLGMGGQPLRPDDYASHLTERVPEITELAQLDSRIICNLDSSDMTPTLWADLIDTIDETRDDYHGYVIVHGTDTMAYTASALAFALKGLDRPVILTGAQRPLAALRTDARRNLADAVELATHDIPEVGICFDGLLLRGCRTTKANAQDYRAFDSPTCAPLARLGVDIEVGDHIRRPSVPFDADARFADGVLSIHVTPGLDPDLLDRMLGEGVRGVVLSVFGSGTIPTTHRALAPVLHRAHHERGVEIVAITSSAGAVHFGLYRNSAGLEEAGVIPGGRLSHEAATTKLMHALAIHADDPDGLCRYMTWNVAGELA